LLFCCCGDGGGGVIAIVGVVLLFMQNMQEISHVYLITVQCPFFVSHTLVGQSVAFGKQQGNFSLLVCYLCITSPQSILNAHAITFSVLFCC
jgi:hypothetical protein